MSTAPNSLRFLWWNVSSFAHFDETRAGESQWPLVPEEYRAKCERVDAGLHEMFGDDPPDLMAFAEMTEEAANELRDRDFPSYAVHSLDLLPRAELQVAMLYDAARGFENPGQLVVPDAPAGTRPMSSVDFLCGSHRIRFFACHWTARFGEESEHTRSDTAKCLNASIYDFIHGADGENRHAIIVGDMNEEPFNVVMEQRLHASRSREFSRRREHYSDRDTRRTRLYNCAWRYVGEQHGHSGSTTPTSTSGTYYWSTKRKWFTLDHVIVSGSLLGDSEPYLDETSIKVMSRPMLLDEKCRPQRFLWNNGNPTGLSDHLPVSGSIVLG